MVEAVGSEVTYRDEGPVMEERYYRIGIEGTEPKIYSGNAAGVLPLTVVGRGLEEKERLGMWGISLDPGGKEGIQEVIGWQMDGAGCSEQASEIWKWRATTWTYERNWLFDSMGSYPAYDGLWLDLSTGGPSQMRMALGSGFWVRNKGMESQVVYQDGLVRMQEVGLLVEVSDKGTVLQMMGQPYAGDTALTEEATTLQSDGAMGGWETKYSDQIWSYLQEQTGYQRSWLFDSGGYYPGYDGTWFDMSTMDFTTQVLKRGMGWWYRATARTGRPAEGNWIWTAPVPY